MKEYLACDAGHYMKPFPVCAYIWREDLEALVGDRVEDVEDSLDIPVREDEAATFYWCSICRAHKRVVSRV